MITNCDNKHPVDNYNLLKAGCTRFEVDKMCLKSWSRSLLSKAHRKMIPRIMACKGSKIQIVPWLAGN